MRIRHWGLGCCVVSAGFQSSVKCFQVGRYFISERRTGDPPRTPFFDKRSDFVDYPSEARLPVAFLRQAKRLRRLPQGRGTDTHPFISDRRTKEHNTPSLWEGWGGLHIIPNPSPREGSVDGWGKNGLLGRVLRFANLSLNSCLTKRRQKMTYRGLR